MGVRDQNNPTPGDALEGVMRKLDVQETAPESGVAAQGLGLRSA